MGGDLDHRDLPTNVALCLGALTAAVFFAVQAAAPAEAYEAIMVIAMAIALRTGRPAHWR